MSEFLHPVVGICGLFLVSADYTTFGLSIHRLLDIRLFPFGSVLNSTVKDIAMQDGVLTYVFVFLGCVPSGEIAGSCGRLLLKKSKGLPQP